MIQKTSFTQKKILIFLGGISLATIFAPLYFFICIISLSFLLYSIMCSNNVFNSFKNGYVFGFGFYIANFYWFGIAVNVYAPNSYILAILSIIIPPTLMSLLTGILGSIVFLLRKQSFIQIIFVTLWLILEYLFERVIFQFPWASLGYCFGVSNTLAQSASLFGVLGLSVIASYGGSIFYELRINQTFYKKTLTLIVILISLTIFGQYKIRTQKNEFLDTKVRIVQPSINQSEKWSKEFFDKNLTSMVDLSRKKITPDISTIIWPESAIPSTKKNAIKPLNNLFQDPKANKNLTLITGTITEKNNQLFVSMIEINNILKNKFTYHKAHLVPFGEYIPEMIQKFLNIKKLTFGDKSYNKGHPKNIKKFGITVTPLICYETIFSNEVRSRVQNSELMINIANDGWYRNSTEPYQHFEITRLRAIENATPLIRVANNGISGVIDSVGTILQSTKINEKKFLDIRIPRKKTTRSIFSIYGDITYIALLLTIILIEWLMGKLLKFIQRTNL